MSKLVGYSAFHVVAAGNFFQLAFGHHLTYIYTLRTK